jgi:hypothetical protein
MISHCSRRKKIPGASNKTVRYKLHPLVLLVPAAASSILALVVILVMTLSSEQDLSKLIDRSESPVVESKSSFSMATAAKKERSILREQDLSKLIDQSESPVVEFKSSLSIATAAEKERSILQEQNKYSLEMLDPYLREHLSDFCTQVPCNKQLPDIFWPPMNFPSVEQKNLLLKHPKANRFVEECHNPTPAHLLRAELQMIPTGSSVSNLECGWGSKHEDFGPRTARLNAGGVTHYHRLLPLDVPDGWSFQHFTDGILPKIMMHLDVIQKQDIKILIPAPVDPVIKAMIQRLGLDPYIRHTGMMATADEMYSGCIVPPIHPLLFRRSRVRLVGRAPTPNPDGKINLIKRTRQNTRNPGRLIKNYPELKQALELEFQDRFVEYDSKDHTFNSTIALFSSAHAVVGSHGGALANLIFAPMDTIVIEAMPCDGNGGLKLGNSGLLYYVFASLLGHTYWRMQVVSNDMDVNIDPATVIRILKDPKAPSDAHLIMSPMESVV